jgi:hypothetical protein
MRFSFGIGVLALFWLCVVVPTHSQVQIPPTSPPQASGPAMPVLPPQGLTTVPITVSADLNVFLSQIMDSLPKGEDADGAWGVIGSDAAGDIGVRYKVWRDNPVIAMLGNTIALDLNVYYQFSLAQRVRNGLLVGGYSWHQLASCGYGEPPRTAHIHFAYQVNWQNNFHLGAAGTSRVDYGPCNLTILDFSAVKKVQGLVDPKVQDALNKLQGVIQGFDFRPQVSQLWAALQQPLQTPSLSGDLHITPVGIAASPLSGSGTTLSDTFVLTARTAIFSLRAPSSGDPPADAFAATVPPATLQALPSPGDGVFRINLIGHLPFSDATLLAKQDLDGTQVDLMNQKNTLTVTEIGGVGRIAYILLRLDGDVQGSFYLTGHMLLDPTNNKLSIQSLTLTPDEVSAFTQAMVTSFQDRSFLSLIESKLRWDLGPQFSSFKDDVNARIANAPLGGGFILHAQATSIVPTYLAALPKECNPVFPPELCKDGVSKATFVFAVEAKGSISVISP